MAAFSGARGATRPTIVWQSGSSFLQSSRWPVPPGTQPNGSGLAGRRSGHLPHAGPPGPHTWVRVPHVTNTEPHIGHAVPHVTNGVPHAWRAVPHVSNAVRHITNGVPRIANGVPRVSGGVWRVPKIVPQLFFGAADPHRAAAATCVGLFKRRLMKKRSSSMSRKAGYGRLFPE